MTTYPKTEWSKMQKNLQAKICQDALDYAKIRYIAGVDVAYTKMQNQEYGCCSIVVLDFHTLKVVDQESYTNKVDVEYLPGFLSFRELPLVLETSKKLKITPDVFVFDGNGILHPRKMGIATHASFYLNKPCIGVAKKFYHSNEIPSFDIPSDSFGASTNIYNSSSEKVGIALRSRLHCKPIFVSVGNYMNLNNAKEIILKCVNKESRIPIPTRLADIETHKLRSQFLQKK